MEFALLFGLLMLAFPVAAIVALVKALSAHERIRQLEARLAVLDGRAAAPGAPIAAPAAAPQPARPAEPKVEAAAAPQAQPAKASEDAKWKVQSAAPAGAPPEAPAAKPAGPGLEERFGTRWTVWVGGLALALGGIFLVRYSIEQGLLGPAVRVFLGGLLAAALVAAGEWARRKENLSGVAGLPAAHIPSILTAAGTAVAYATAYVAYALYDFLPPAVAFVLLGIIAVATLAAALLHGRVLAALGLAAAYVTPLMVASDAPNFLALYIYLTVVTAAAFALARARLWRWLAVTATVLSVWWIFAGAEPLLGQSLAPHAFFAVAGFVLAALLIVNGFLFGPDPVPGAVDRVSSGTLGAFVFGAALLLIMREQEPATLIAFAVLCAGAVAVAWRTEAAAGAVVVSALLAALVMANWVAIPAVETLVAPPGPVAGGVPEQAKGAVGPQLLYGFGLAALFGASGFLAQGRSEKPLPPMLWATAAVVAPVIILVALYYRVADFDRSVPFAALALLLAALYGIATEVLTKRSARPGSASAAAIFAVGAIASLALALTMALEKGWLTVALALMVPGIAYVAEKRPLPALRLLVAVVGMAVAVRVAWEPRIVGADVGTTPIFNWLLWGYGVPALSFWVAGSILRRRADDWPARITDSLAILFTILLVGLQIRHYITGGDIYRQATSLAELALQVCSGLAMAIGLERLRQRTGSIVHNYGALLIAAGTFVLIVFGLLGTENPVFTRQAVGGTFINLVLLGYGIPAVLAIALALIAQSTRPMSYRTVAAATAVILALAYLTLQVRVLFWGPVIGPLRTIGDAEQYTYSAVWLVFGVVLLLAGIALGSKPARLASAAVITLTIAKVFFVDMADLTGVYRALSFIGLGIVLVGIGALYQRLLFPAAAKPASEPPPAA